MTEVSRIELVELIEEQASKLSPQGRVLWEELEPIAELIAPEEATPETLPPPTPEQVETIGRTFELTDSELLIIEQLMELVVGLRSSDLAQNKGFVGEPSRNRAVIVAASLKDRRESKRVMKPMTTEQAVARLREPQESREMVQEELEEVEEHRPATAGAQEATEHRWWEFWR